MASPLIIATLAAGLAGFPAPQAEGPVGHDGARVMQVASDCSSAVSRVVRETGGQLLSVYPSNDGQNCVVTVLVQGNGERPRKVTMRVPM
ncbi:hypothetical protein [Agrobacterium rubi]|uniref:Uncharacterized protein n=1 Tax=Agrobacterium rubi TaxID=28099 RepID=A0AAE7R4N9_9HYPH|nr:hypothetical protein [Agrobacterium rubi]NTE85811.1 hypothetical protein [Agrobacterium rubi]NTF01743.1 hypothetical protein [Agrobacterium rubi]NTF35986.1 hypothetical protein [Agrobacterium rubi]OCJ53208.1 hypothetical protein A6U92_24920 [Agrobacterium rubi]QTG01079.1 hypothetical protein G6M88_12085 [Agrobacterium rubi]